MSAWLYDFSFASFSLGREHPSKNTEVPWISELSENDSRCCRPAALATSRYSCWSNHAHTAAARGFTSEPSLVPSSSGTWPSSATPRCRRRRRPCRPTTTTAPRAPTRPAPASPPRSRAWPPAPWARWRRPASRQCTPCSPLQTSSFFSAFQTTTWYCCLRDCVSTLKNVSAHGGVSRAEWASIYIHGVLHVLTCRASFMSTCQWPMVSKAAPKTGGRADHWFPSNRELMQAPSPWYGSWWGHLIWGICTAVTGGLSYLRLASSSSCLFPSLALLVSPSILAVLHSFLKESERPYRFILVASFESRLQLQLQRRLARSWNDVNPVNFL